MVYLPSVDHALHGQFMPHPDSPSDSHKPAAAPRAGISAFITCCNEADNIRRCLESVKWCDEIVVVDSGSTDGTLEICKQFTDRIYQRPWPGFVEQKRFALEQCTCDWVLNIDADEEVSPSLKAEMLAILQNSRASPATIRGFYVPRVVFYIGRWWFKGGWYPEYRLRFCQRAYTSWGGHDPHEKAIVDGATAKLKQPLHHYTYTDFSDQVRSLNSLSSSAAASLFEHGKRASFVEIAVRPIVRFVKFYFIKFGYREGLAGFIVACLEAYYVFLKYAKLWEIQRAKN